MRELQQQQQQQQQNAKRENLQQQQQQQQNCGKQVSSRRKGKKTKQTNTHARADTGQQTQRLQKGIATNKIAKLGMGKKKQNKSGNKIAEAEGKH